MKKEKVTKIKLPWAEKFRELINDGNNTASQICFKFLRYCKAEEIKINKKFGDDREDWREINKKFGDDREECRKARER